MDRKSEKNTNGHLSKAKDYAILIVKKGPNYQKDVENGKPIVWQHGTRNMSLREDGVLSIVCPIIDDSEYAGIGVFSRSVEDAKLIMEEDPAVKAGVLTYSVHPGKGFPGSILPL